ncbi:uncharacterized protein BO87DRAFT_378230 [Aspergillus neoniger CBS 115656]|uniref:Uncharacterized protein n=1 Tax=Aspergillus neoniger (strain CBS 115656) TaxID=1448310 RepID=A0A318Z5X8_ASPNB|nr:hypothetical protein BO87DRAFT_378230 [Aspergillus neoniger CBS 115656]PYH32352.1 hypothetical protein BO87DRAFT_378230 [Aspergillus neoniger CBS 115656]
MPLNSFLALSYSTNDALEKERRMGWGNQLAVVAAVLETVISRRISPPHAPVQSTPSESVRRKATGSG